MSTIMKALQRLEVQRQQTKAASLQEEIALRAAQPPARGISKKWTLLGVVLFLCLAAGTAFFALRVQSPAPAASEVSEPPLMAVKPPVPETSFSRTAEPALQVDHASVSEAAAVDEAPAAREIDSENFASAKNFEAVAQAARKPIERGEFVTRSKRAVVEREAALQKSRVEAASAEPVPQTPRKSSNSPSEPAAPLVAMIERQRETEPKRNTAASTATGKSAAAPSSPPAATANVERKSEAPPVSEVAPTPKLEPSTQNPPLAPPPMVAAPTVTIEDLASTPESVDPAAAHPVASPDAAVGLRPAPDAPATPATTAAPAALPSVPSESSPAAEAAAPLSLPPSANRAAPSSTPESVEAQSATPSSRNASIPEFRIRRTIWHPQPERRIAVIELLGSKEVLNLSEGDTIGTLTVKQIMPSNVVFLHGSVEVTRRVGALP